MSKHRKHHKNSKHQKHRHRKRSQIQPGEAPGSFTPSQPTDQAPHIRVVAYNSEDYFEDQLNDLDAIIKLREKWPVVWIDVGGINHVETLVNFQALFQIHPLALEDVVHNEQRPKVDTYDSHLYIVARMASAVAPGTSDQVSFFLGSGFLLTFRENDADVFEPIRRRLQTGRKTIRSAKSDYLCYALLDAMIDSFFPRLEHIQDELEQYEATVFDNPKDNLVQSLQSIRRELREIRRVNTPHKDVVHALLKDDRFIQPTTHIYLSDCADHAVRVAETVDLIREETSDLMSTYLSSVSNRMNEVMKVLTIVAAIFIPLTFIAGIYGMNFNPEASPWNMPELSSRLGYPIVLGIMALIGIGLVIYFRFKKWF